MNVRFGKISQRAKGCLFTIYNSTYHFRESPLFQEQAPKMCRFWMQIFEIRSCDSDHYKGCPNTIDHSRVQKGSEWWLCRMICGGGGSGVVVDEVEVKSVLA